MSSSSTIGTGMAGTSSGVVGGGTAAAIGISDVSPPTQNHLSSPLVEDGHPPANDVDGPTPNTTGASSGTSAMTDHPEKDWSVVLESEATPTTHVPPSARQTTRKSNAKLPAGSESKPPPKLKHTLCSDSLDVPPPPPPPPPHHPPQCLHRTQLVHPLPPPPAPKPVRSSSSDGDDAVSAGSDEMVPLLLLSLPADSLHCVASFLIPKDWSSMSRASRGANRACREVFRRVRMHGFRCATEVVTAWMQGHHADARELSALYIRSGVPVYPLCLGHSYHTLTWRMGIEARDLESNTNSNNSGDANADANNAGGAGSAVDANENDDVVSNSGNSSNISDSGSGNRPDTKSSIHKVKKVNLDRFYTERYEARSQDGTYIPSLTYLEEKSLFWRNRRAEAEEEDDLAPGGGGPQSRALGSRRNSLQRLPGNQQPILPPIQQQRLGMPDLPLLGGAAAGGPRGGPLLRRTMSSSALAGTPSSSAYQTLQHRTASRHRPKMSIPVHRHLADQHLLGRPGVDDDNGTMRSAPLSLSADFYHPHLTPVLGFNAGAADADYATAVATVAASSGGGVGGGDGALVPFYPVASVAGSSEVASAAEGMPPLGPASSAAAGLVGVAEEDPASTTAAAAASAPAALAQDPPSEQSLGEAAAGAGGLARAPSNDDSEETLGAEGESPSPSDANALRNLPGGGGAAASLMPVPQLHHAVSFGPGPMLSHDPHSDPSSPEHHLSILSDVELDVYSSATAGPKSAVVDEIDGSADLRRQLRTRFGVYERRLDSLLAHFNSSGFDECLLDFWDEFLPLSGGVHFYDRHTPVPRLSGLHRFLTKPCPKSIGIVQCEIERIKISSKKKVSMKGRLFPTYEYRLFMRDRRHGGTNDAQPGPDQPPRKDTVLMTAKNRGRNHQGALGASPASSGTKRGVNNYYLYMPQEGDIKSHHDSVNSANGGADASSSSNSSSSSRTTDYGGSGSGSSPSPSPSSSASSASVAASGATSPVLLGRLQSNFIGTEFQIFSPTIRKIPIRTSSHESTSPNNYNDANDDDDSDNEFGGYESGGISDNPTVPSPSRRRGGLRRRLSNPRLARRGVSEGQTQQQQQQHQSSEGSNVVSSSRSSTPERGSRRSTGRRGSWPSLSRSKSRNRRAIANSVADSPSEHGSRQYQPVLCEVEDGAITYTANLLGNRPRIMDVCVPKVSDDGIAGAEWRRYCEGCESLSDRPESSSSTGNRMLNRFKQLQQRLDNPDGDGGGNAADDGTSEDYGLLALQNRPPWWNIELGAFVLNFGGRVSVASVKNFQLCDRNDQEHIMLQFGRIQGRHAFTMDFQYPLTAVQAFAIAISSLQSKISFG